MKGPISTRSEDHELCARPADRDGPDGPPLPHRIWDEDPDAESGSDQEVP